MPVRRGQLEILVDLNEIRGPGEPQRIEPQAMKVLELLVMAPGRVLSREELLDSAWPGRMVADATLTGVISRLRNSLNAAGVTDIRIETRSKRGYVLVEKPQGLPRARRSWAWAAGLTVLAVISVTVAIHIMKSPPPLQSLDGVRLDFDITSSSGMHVAPVIWLKEGTEGAIKVGGDRPLDLSVVPVLDSRGMIRLKLEANSLSHWAGFDHVIGLDKENVFSIKAGDGKELFAVKFVASLHDGPRLP